MQNQIKTFNNNTENTVENDLIDLMHELKAMIRCRDKEISEKEALLLQYEDKLSRNQKKINQLTIDLKNSQLEIEDYKRDLIKSQEDITYYKLEIEDYNRVLKDPLSKTTKLEEEISKLKDVLKNQQPLHYQIKDKLNAGYINRVSKLRKDKEFLEKFINVSLVCLLSTILCDFCMPEVVLALIVTMTIISLVLSLMFREMVLTKMDFINKVQEQVNDNFDSSKLDSSKLTKQVSYKNLVTESSNTVIEEYNKKDKKQGYILIISSLVMGATMSLVSLFPIIELFALMIISTLMFNVSIIKLQLNDIEYISKDQNIKDCKIIDNIFRSFTKYTEGLKSDNTLPQQ